MHKLKELKIVLIIVGFLGILYTTLATYKIITLMELIKNIEVYFFSLSLILFWLGLYLYSWNQKKYKYTQQLIIALVVIVIATLIDFATHSSRADFYVPFEYYVGKIVAATLWGMATLIVFRKIEGPKMKAFLFSFFIAATLQIKYFFQGYNKFFVFLFLFLHFFMFLIPALIIFPKYKEIFSSKK